MLHLLGLEDDAKIKLIAQKINELQFEFQKADEFSTQMAAEILRKRFYPPFLSHNAWFLLEISAELSNIGLEIEQSVQNNCIGGQSQIASFFAAVPNPPLKYLEAIRRAYRWIGSQGCRTGHEERWID